MNDLLLPLCGAVFIIGLLLVVIGRLLDRPEPRGPLGFVPGDHRQWKRWER